MPDTTPVVVVGSGAAGLAAALAASSAGADVLVVERAQAVGGTTAMSGGVVWMPAHGRKGRSTVIEDSPEEALAYLGAAADGDVDTGLMQAFVSDARRVTDEIENRTPIEWEVLEHWPDYRGELPGAKSGGRSLWPRALRLAPEIEGRVQVAFDQPPPPASDAALRDPALPAHDGVVLRGHVRGRALAGGLLAAVVDSGIEVRTGARATRLVVEDGRVVGVVVDGHPEAGRVVLASGGFQHDAGLVGEFLGGPHIVAMGPTGCSGDGLRMALDAGAVLGNTSEGWWMPAMHAPGEDVDGVRHYRPLHGERAQPGAIMVDRFGRRFVDEAQSYGEVGRAMRRAGPGHPRYPAAPCWMVFDAASRRRYPVGPVEPGGADPDWLARADGLAELARLMGVPSGALERSVTRFNAGAALGEDHDFGRGTFLYDRWIGDPSAPHPTLAPLREAPFYALEVLLGCMGTKGGPRTDDHGRVLGAGRVPVPGLYAAGNAAASPFGTATAAGGATLGPALVFGFRAGEVSAGDA